MAIEAVDGGSPISRNGVWRRRARQGRAWILGTPGFLQEIFRLGFDISEYFETNARFWGRRTALGE